MQGALTFAALFLVSAISPIALDVVIAGLALYSLKGPSMASRCLMLVALLRAANPAFVKANTATGVLTWAACILASLRVLSSLKERQTRLLWPLWAFAAVAAVLSSFSSSNHTVSLFKVAVFALVAPGTIVAFTGQTTKELEDCSEWMKSVAIAILLASALTLPLPSISGAVNGSFQGILNHPQTFGVLIAPMTAWAVSGLFTSEIVSLPRQSAVALAMATLMFMTSARTAALACAAGVTISYLTLYFRQRSARDSIRRVRATTVLALMTIFLAIAAATSADFRQFAHDFVFKGSEAATVGESFSDARGKAIKAQFANFLLHPLLGNGFGVYAETKGAAGSGFMTDAGTGYDTSVTTFYGIPISAPIEKGVAFTALMEETGVFGTAMFLVALVTLAREVHKASDLRTVAVFWSVILVNIGENVLFSFGGIGLYVWLVIALAVAQGARPRRTRPHMSRRLATTIRRLRYPNVLR